MKLFADLERKRREAENKISNEAAKTREAQLQAEEKKTVEKEFAKNWEDSRQGRVNSWLNFTGKPVHNSKKSVTSSVPNIPNAVPSTTPQGQNIAQDEASHHSTGGYGCVRTAWNPQTNVQSHSSPYGASHNKSVYGRANSDGQSYQQCGSNTASAPVDKKPKKKKEKRFSPMGFRPPKHKPETRD